MRNVEAGLGRGEGGSERIREAWGEGGVKTEGRGRGEGREDRGARGNSGLSRLSGANPDAGRPFPGPFWDVKALKNPPPTPGLNSSLKNTPQIQKFNLKCKSGDLELKLKFH